MNRGIRKAIRTILQLVAGGGLTALVSALAGGLDPSVQGIVLGAWTTAIAFAQNALESVGTIPVLLPTQTAHEEPPVEEAV